MGAKPSSPEVADPLRARWAALPIVSCQTTAPPRATGRSLPPACPRRYPTRSLLATAPAPRATAPAPPRAPARRPPACPVGAEKPASRATFSTLWQAERVYGKADQGFSGNIPSECDRWSSEGPFSTRIHATKSKKLHGRPQNRFGSRSCCEEGGAAPPPSVGSVATSQAIPSEALPSSPNASREAFVRIAYAGERLGPFPKSS